MRKSHWTRREFLVQSSLVVAAAAAVPFAKASQSVTGNGTSKKGATSGSLYTRYRFTDRARKVMRLAGKAAGRLNHEYVDTEHVLLGLIEEGSGVAANVLKYLGVEQLQVQLEIETIVPAGPGRLPKGKHPLTPRARNVIEFAVGEARNLNHNYVGTEHLLLGLMRDHEGVAAQVLMNLNLKCEDVRAAVLNLLGHGIYSWE
jgi:ATP-dependent Clp protease ATP-binding subunit ClpC